MPRQGACLLLSEYGHVITACRFTKNLTPAQVEISIIEAFDGKIPAGVDIELFTSVHTSLVALTLATGQAGIHGVILHRLFKQKPIYIRPSCRLISTSESQVKTVKIRIFVEFSCTSWKHTAYRRHMLYIIYL